MTTLKPIDEDVSIDDQMTANILDIQHHLRVIEPHTVDTVVVAVRRINEEMNDLNNFVPKPLICQNDFDCRYGTCIFISDHSNSYCFCEDGFMGEYCENKCTAHCHNGGQCIVAQSDQPEFNVKAGHSIICECPIEYAGRLCERFANETITVEESTIKSNSGALSSVIIGSIVSVVLIGYIMVRRLRSRRLSAASNKDHTARSLQLGKEAEYRTEYRTNVRGVWM